MPTCSVPVPHANRHSGSPQSINRYLALWIRRFA